MAEAAEAHELALKTAETDATKRALATFGNRFGLGLYDKERVVQPPATSPAKSFRILDETGQVLSEGLSAEAFCSGLRQLIAASTTVEILDGVFSANQPSVGDLRSAAPNLRNSCGEHYADVLERLLGKRRVVLAQFQEGGAGPEGPKDIGTTQTHALAEPPALASNVTALGPARASRIGQGAAIEKSALEVSTTHRARDKAHLHAVAAEPCLICSQQPCHAHHLTFAQPRGLSLKVSDEFTVPLSVEHHNALHQSGNERVWWKEHAIEPLEFARQYWERSRGLNGSYGSVPGTVTAE